MKNPLKRKDNFNSYLIPGLAIASGIALKKCFDYGYKSVKKENPPETLRHNEHNIGYVIGWTVVTSAAVGMVRLMTRDLLKTKIR